MHIWLINQYAVPPSETGSTRHFSLARELIRQGHQVTIVASSFNHYAKRESRLSPEEDLRLEVIDGIRFLWLYCPSYAGNTKARIANLLAFAYRVWREAPRAGLAPPNLVFGSSPHLLATLVAYMHARRYGVPFVMEVRDLWPQSLVDLGNHGPSHPIVRALGAVERFLYRRATRIVTLLPGAVDHIVDKGATREHVVYIPNGIDPAAVTLPGEPNDEGPFTVMYAGSLGLANAMDTVLGAAELLHHGGWSDRIKLRIIGEGPEKSPLQAFARERGLTNVEFLDAVPKDRIFEHLSQAHAFVVALRDTALYRHGISLNKLFDYLAMARPIIYAGRAYNDPVAEAQAGVSVAPGDPRAIADAILAVYHLSPEERREMGCKGRAFVEQHHDTRVLAQRLGETFEDVLQDRNSWRPLPASDLG